MRGADDTLSRAVSHLLAAQERALVGLEYDAEIDGGEWSAAANERRLAIDVEVIAVKHGFDSAEDLFDKAAERISGKWIWNRLGYVQHVTYDALAGGNR